MDFHGFTSDKIGQERKDKKKEVIYPRKSVAKNLSLVSL